MLSKLKNQADLYLELDYILRSAAAVSSIQHSYDISVTVNSIVRVEAINLLIERPDINPSHFKQATESLYKGLSDPYMLTMLSELEGAKSMIYSIRFTDEYSIHYDLRNIDYYLFESFGESRLMRDQRVDEFLFDFLMCYPLASELKHGQVEQVKDLFYQVIQQVARENYFLENKDLMSLVQILIQYYNLKDEFFYSNNQSPGWHRNVTLVNRNVRIRSLNNYTRRDL